MDDEYRKAFAEVLEVLDHVDKKLTMKIPRKFKLFLEQNADKTHVIMLDTKKSLVNQNISNISKAILAMVYRDYISKGEKATGNLEEKIKNNIIKPYEEKDLNIDLKTKSEDKEKLPAKRRKNKFVEMFKKIFKIN